LSPPSGPVGVFDSGVGGLTVLAALRRALPREDYVYLGDTARLPYGTKSADSVLRYSLQCADVLVSRGIRCLVVACNTASASSLDALRARYPQLEVFGVIEPGAAAAVDATRRGHVAVIATEGTVQGGAYQRAIARRAPAVRVTAQACSLFVSLAEEGWTQGPIAEAVAHRYLDELFAGGSNEAPDTLILGCTHFPALLGALRAVLPDDVVIVDSAATVAQAVARDPGADTRAGARGTITWLATDGAARFARVSRIFLDHALRAEDIEVIDL
jgi:glutamate racemase